ncbi:helix-turn-helix domain-containing protein [Parasphingorhabdus sp.]|uniref:helix-turn-helix domain-containing protein n=1 Tax=Parasphingorhabdus sp. TaxID=2709688 RepID=UPI003FA6F66A
MTIRSRLTKGRDGFGKRVAWERSQNGWTLADLGRKVGVSGTCVWNWEEGNTHPRPGSLSRLAQALNVSADHLLEGEDVEAIAETDDRSAGEPDAPVSMAELINSSREAIASAAGLPSSKVRITLDYGE